MIEEVGVVVGLAGEWAEVETRRTSACGGCAAREGCGASALAQVFGARPSVVRAANPILALPGERVVVGLPEGAFLRAAAVLYLLPLLGLLIGALAGQTAAGERGAVLGGLTGLTGGLVGVRRLSRRHFHHPEYQPVILRRDGVVRLAEQS